MNRITWVQGRSNLWWWLWRSCPLSRRTRRRGAGTLGRRRLSPIQLHHAVSSQYILKTIWFISLQTELYYKESQLATIIGLVCEVCNKAWSLTKGKTSKNHLWSDFLGPKGNHFSIIVLFEGSEHFFGSHKVRKNQSINEVCTCTPMTVRINHF